MIAVLDELAKLVNIILVISGIAFIYMWVFDWLLGRIGRYLKGYWLLIEFALHRKAFKEWLAIRRGQA